MLSLFNKVGIGENLGLELVDELIKNNILYLSKSREKPIWFDKKQKIKKELKHYAIEPKLYFTKPFYRFWFSFIENNKDSLDIYKSALDDYRKWGYRLTSLVFEQLSIELLKEYYQNRAKVLEFGSYWDRYSEFDIYCKLDSGKFILGECKYKSKPVTYAELNKLKFKAQQSNLIVDYYALFSKSGFTNEFKRELNSNLLLFDIDDFDKLLL